MTAYLTENARSAADAQRLAPQAFISGYHVAFSWGGILLAMALVTAITLVTARKDDVPAEGAVVAA